MVDLVFFTLLFLFRFGIRAKGGNAFSVMRPLRKGDIAGQVTEGFRLSAIEWERVELVFAPLGAINKKRRRLPFGDHLGERSLATPDVN